MKPKFFSLSSILAAGMILAGCNPSPTEPSIYVPGVAPRTAPRTAAEGTWAAEDAAHISEQILGKANSGPEGTNLSGISPADRASLLGDVEAWARKNHLTGIPLFGDGGWSLYKPRVQSPISKNYVNNYGFGILREGKITSPLTADQEPNAEYREYLHLGLPQVDGKINPFDSNNSTASTLLSYISGSLYGQRLVKNNAGGYESRYEWYSRLADGEPEALDWNAATNTATKWRIKVRTGADATNPIRYKTKSTKSIGGTAISSFNDTPVTAQDYVDYLRLMLNGKNQYSYAGQYVTRFVGAQAYNEATAGIKVFTPEDDAEWAKVGIKVLDDQHIEIDMTTTMTPTYFKMTNSEITPVNRDFFKLVTGWNDDASFKPLSYGTSSEDSTLTPADTILSVGPYTLRTYSYGTGSDNEIIYDRNDEWIDRKLENVNGYEVYAIKGVKYNINSAYGGNDGLTVQYNDYLTGKLDASAIPLDKRSEWEGDKPEKYISANATITSLQINSAASDRWEEVFGKDGINWKNQKDYVYDEAKAKAYRVKPIMSNYDFLDGLYFSINRQELADSLMVKPSGDWLGEEYLIDLDSGTSYNSTAAHISAMKDWAPETYGYNLSIAQAKFTSAIDQLLNQELYTAGTPENPTTIKITLQIARENQRANWATKVEGYIEGAFNQVGRPKGVVLDVELPQAPSQASEVYAIITAGTYDLLWGGISGGTGDAFGMTGVYIDDYNTGLQMSIGADPKTVDNSIHYQGYSYSMQGIYYAIARGNAVVIQDGVYTGDKQ